MLQRRTKLNPGDCLEVELARKLGIVDGVSVGIRRQNGGQPVLHIQLERGGDLSYMDAERPPQLPECAPKGPTVEAPAVGVVDAFASVSPYRSRNFRQAAGIARSLRLVNFGAPNNYLSSPRFGEATQTLNRFLGGGDRTADSRRCTKVGGPRSMQFALRLQF